MANTPAVLVPSVAGNKNALNITATTVVKSTAGTVRMVSVNTAGSVAGGVYDTALVADVSSGTLAFVIPEAATSGPQDWKFFCANGITVVPPTGGVVSVSFE